MAGSAFRDALEYYRDTAKEFTVERTGYTASIKDQDGKKYLFAESPVKLRLFGVFSKLKAEIRRNDIPVVNEKAVKYYNFEKAKKLQTLPAVAWCVDISSAYITALHKLDMISDELFQILNSLPKTDRLKVVGMLATQKTVLHYAGGKIVHTETRTSETRPAFFAACAAVGQVMENVAEHPDHLFYWVDGAFFSRDVPEVETYFAEEGYRTKTETVTDLKWSKSGNYLFYTKEGSRKYLCVPTRKPSKEWIQQLLNEPRTP